MKKIYILLSLIFIVNKIQAQQVDTESQNYKHIYSPNQEHHHSSNGKEMRSDEISLHNQKTQKKTSKQYVIAPTDSVMENNVQGKKSKKNYKNQVN